MAKKTDPLWRQAEDKVYKAFEDAGFYTETLVDTRVAGNFVRANTADAVVARDGVAAFLEVKSAQKDDYPRSDLTPDQVRRQFKAARAGAPGFYAFVFPEKNTLPSGWE